MENHSEKKYTKRILFAGMPDMALACIKKLALNGINIVGVIPPFKNDPTYNLMVSAVNALNLPLIEFDRSLYEKDFLAKIKELNADLGVVASYNKKLPKELLNLTKDGFINLHPSKLPDYRGANPYSHVIINGEEESAVTLHFMDENFDTGDIISQYCFSIDLNETMGTLFYRTNEICASMLFEALDYYETHYFPRKKQEIKDTLKTAENLSFDKQNTFIDWNKSAEEIERFIRALNPFIGALTYFRGIILRINSAVVINKHHHYKAGEIVKSQKELIIACGENMIKIGSIQYGAFFIGDSFDFIERVKPKQGELLYSEQA